MNESDIPSIPELSTEISRLHQELQLRDELIEQLSQELLRLVKGDINFIPPLSEPGIDFSQLQVLREQLQSVEEQVRCYKEEIRTRDTEIYQLRQSVQKLTDRNRMLEQVVEELPQIYRRKFEERIKPVRDQVVILQRENRQLQAELQSVTYRLALKNRHTNHSGIDLPTFPPSEITTDNISTPQNT
ncbi:MAG: Npun_F5560 family protein [Dolichospermum sp.]